MNAVQIGLNKALEPILQASNMYNPLNSYYNTSMGVISHNYDFSNAYTHASSILDSMPLNNLPKMDTALFNSYDEMFKNYRMANAAFEGIKVPHALQTPEWMKLTAPMQAAMKLFDDSPLSKMYEKTEWLKTINKLPQMGNQMNFINNPALSAFDAKTKSNRHLYEVTDSIGSTVNFASQMQSIANYIATVPELNGEDIHGDEYSDEGNPLTLLTTLFELVTEFINASQEVGTDLNNYLDKVNLQMALIWNSRRPWVKSVLLLLGPFIMGIITNIVYDNFKNKTPEDAEKQPNTANYHPAATTHKLNFYRAKISSPLYISPSSKSKKMGVIQQGETVHFVEMRRVWMHVYFTNPLTAEVVCGYVRADDFSELELK